MFQLLSIASCSVTTHVWDQSVPILLIPTIRCVAKDCGKLCHCPHKKRINHCRFKWYREESTILAFHMKANRPLHLSSWGGTSPFPSASLLMSHTTLCQCFPQYSGAHVLYPMLPHKCQTKKGSLLQSACYIHTTNPTYSWPSLLSPIQFVLQGPHAKFSCRQLIPACTAAWCYTSSAASFGFHKLPVTSSFQAISLYSSLVIHSVRHFPTCCREDSMPIEHAGPCSPQHSDH